MTNTKRRTLITFVLDETGSMETIKDDTIGGFNEYIKTLKDSKEDYLFTLIKFDSNHHDVVHHAVPISEVHDLNAQSYTPGAATPLVDACMKAIKATDAKLKGETMEDSLNVALVIQTDGLENASTEFKNEDLVKLIKEKTEAGWLITFLGAGIDAFAQAKEFGISAQHALSYDRCKTRVAYGAAGQSMEAFAKTGVTAAAQWSTVQRVATGGHIPPAKATTKVEAPKAQSIVDDIKI